VGSSHDALYCPFGTIFYQALCVRWLDGLISADKRSPLLVMQNSAGTALVPVAPQSLGDPEETENGEYQGTPVNESGGPLVDEDGEEGPCDGNGGCNVTFCGGESVGGGCGFEEEEAEEDEDLGPDTCWVGQGIDTEGFEGGEDDEDGSETVIEGEWEMDPEFVVDVLPNVMFPDNVVDVTDGAANEQSEDECYDVMLASPYVDVNAGQDSKEGETPADAIDDGALSAGEELVDDISKKEEMNQRPYKESPRSGSEVCLLSRIVDALRICYSINVRTEEKDVDDDVDDLEEDTIFPSI